MFDYSKPTFASGFAQGDKACSVVHRNNSMGRETAIRSTSVMLGAKSTMSHHVDHGWSSKLSQFQLYPICSMVAK